MAFLSLLLPGEVEGGGRSVLAFYGGTQKPLRVAH